jgi:2-(1,2-epoxy-1,2-dihydrophenyl)acetyl-CoA isomerase
MNASDVVIAADSAYFASAYRNIALTADGGGSWALPRIVGLRRAMEIMLLAERFDAAQALQWGLVNRVVPAGDLDAAIAAVVANLVQAPVLAVRNARRLMRESLARSLSEQLAAEAVSFGACAATPDFAEGIAAFFAKRPARFGGTEGSGP